MMDWKTLFPKNPPLSRASVNVLTAALDEEERAAKFYDAWSAYKRDLEKEKRKEDADTYEDTAEWEQEVEMGFHKKYGKSLFRSTTRSAVPRPPSSDNSSDGEDAPKSPMTTFVDAATGLPITVADHSNFSSQRCRKVLSGYNQSIGTIQV
jgi:hypothetical protein